MSKIQYQHAECRSLGHQWKHDKRAERVDGVVVITSTCSSCTTVRKKHIFRRTGETYYVNYSYPATYPAVGDQKRAPAEWRQMYVSELVGDDDD